MAKTRRWRAIPVTDCSASEPEREGGPLVFFSGVLLDAGLARCWERGGSVCHASAGGRSYGVLVPCAGRGLEGRVVVLFSYYAPVSDSGFDNERRTSLNELSTLLASFPARSVLILGGNFNAEVGYCGVGEDACLGSFAHSRRNRSGHQVVEWAKGESLRFLEPWHKSHTAMQTGHLHR